MRIFIALAVCLGTLAVVPSASSQQSAGRTIVAKVDPRYPDLARPMKLEGTVRLNVLVATNGTVKSIRAVGGNPLLLRAAQDAISRWKWAPAGQETSELVELHFRPD
jgi:TonB family protein